MPLLGAVVLHSPRAFMPCTAGGRAGRPAAGTTRPHHHPMGQRRQPTRKPAAHRVAGRRRAVQRAGPRGRRRSMASIGSACCQHGKEAQAGTPAQHDEGEDGSGAAHAGRGPRRGSRRRPDRAIRRGPGPRAALQRPVEHHQPVGNADGTASVAGSGSRCRPPRCCGTARYGAAGARSRACSTGPAAAAGGPDSRPPGGPIGVGQLAQHQHLAVADRARRPGRATRTCRSRRHAPPARPRRPGVGGKRRRAPATPACRRRAPHRFAHGPLSQAVQRAGWRGRWCGRCAPA